MKRINISFVLLSLFVSFALILGNSGAVFAQEPAPESSIELPKPPTELQNPIQLDSDQTDIVQPQALSLPPLKAVLLVGSIDGDTGPTTSAEVAYMRLAADVLRRNGVQVIEFYPPNGNWDQIITAVNGAHFLLYRGHGIFTGDIQHPTYVGGMKMGGIIYTNDMILRDLRPAPNAIVMMYGCYTAGSSGDDRFSIASSEAQGRIVQYSNPYFDLGAAGYYSSWFGDGYAKILDYLFQGHTLGSAYTSFPDYNPTRSEKYSLPNQPGMVLWMDKDYWSPYPVPTPQYNHAFAGLENSTLQDLFAQELVLSSSSINVMVTPGYSTITRTIQLTSQPVKSFPWTASLSILQGGSGWVTLSSTNGTAPSDITLQIPSGKPVGKYRATLQIATSDPYLLGNPQTVNVEMIVTPTIYRVFLPSVKR